MVDRVVRDELLDSDRWLCLSTDSERLVFVGLLLKCDDFGNFEAGLPRLFRFLSSFTHIKTHENAAIVLLHLADQDLIRGYKVADREFFHIPRLRPHRQYLVRRCPPSPWCDISAPLGKTKRIINKGLASNVVTTSQKRSNDVAQGVGVGVGVGVGENTRTRTRRPVDNFPSDAPAKVNGDGNKLPKVNGNGQFSAALGKAWGSSPQAIEAKGRELGITAHAGESLEAYRARLHAEIEKRKRLTA